MPVSNWFSVAREGATTDDREIKREWIEQMAANFDAKKYGARVNLEHFLSINPDSTFRAYGDVIALKTEERDGKLHLLARVDATDELVQLHEKRQKIYTSVEVDPEFADTGEAYLVGLAMTDSPASLGTEMMQFAAQAKQNPFSARKQRPENLFTESVEIALQFTQEPAPKAEDTKLLDKVKALFSKHKSSAAADFAGFKTELEQTLELLTEKIIAASAEDKNFAQLKTAHAELKQEFTELKALLDSAPAPQKFNRPAATGGAEELTDC